MLIRGSPARQRQVITNTREFEHAVMLMLTNAIVYNDEDHFVCIAARGMRKDAQRAIAVRPIAMAGVCRGGVRVVLACLPTHVCTDARTHAHARTIKAVACTPPRNPDARCTLMLMHVHTLNRTYTGITRYASRM